MNTLGRFISLTLAMAAASAQAANINTANPADITAFQSGATVEKFDDLPALEITSYGTVAVPAANQFSSRDINNANLPVFNSGGASFNNPASNAGTLVGVFNPQDLINGEVSSAENVIGPLIVGSSDAFGTGFMEVIFQNPVSKVGFSVTHGSLQLILKDVNNSNLPGADATINGTAGNFIGSDRGVADIGGITILTTSQNDSFTLDDFTFLVGTSNNNVPDAGSAWNLAIAGATLFLTGRRLRLAK